MANIINECIRCKDEPIYFFKNHAKILSLDIGMVPFDPFIHQVDTTTRIEYNKNTIIKSVRQTGVSSTLIYYALWYALFHSFKTVALISDTINSRDSLNERFRAAVESLPFWLKPEIKRMNRQCIEFENDATILFGIPSPNNVRGRTINRLLIENLAFVDYDRAVGFFQSVFPTMNAGRDTKTVISSCPQEKVDFFGEMWYHAVRGDNSFIPQEIGWYDVPGRGNKWVYEQQQILPERRFRQEILGELL